MVFHISGTERALENPLNWKTRLNIALNAAQGLEYLHKSCKHPIIHRDVKSSNILLSTDMVAKVADFGLSKITMEEGVSHISTLVKGTAGYLDPEYYAKQQLTDKSDVFSFGVVLLELICGRQPIDTSFHHENQWNIGVWVRPFLQSGILQPIVDQALGNNYNVESMWKVAETAMRSIEPYSVNRPTMTEVVCDIREAIEMENGHLYDASSNTSNSYSQQPIATMLRTNHHSTYPIKCV
jgi:serine/threonine protein kinase